MTCSRPWSLEMFASSLNFGKSEWIPQAQRCCNRQQMTWKEKNIEKWDCETFLQCSVLHQVQKEGNKCQQLDRKQRLQRVSNQKTKKNGEALTGAFFPQDGGLQTPTGSNWFLEGQKRSETFTTIQCAPQPWQSLQLPSWLKTCEERHPAIWICFALSVLVWNCSVLMDISCKKNAIHCDRIKNDRQDDATNICELYPSQYCRVHFLFTSLGFSAKQHISWAFLGHILPSKRASNIGHTTSWRLTILHSPLLLCGKYSLTKHISCIETTFFVNSAADCHLLLHLFQRQTPPQFQIQVFLPAFSKW